MCLKSYAKKIPYLKKLRDTINDLVNPLMISQLSLKKVMLKQAHLARGVLLDIGSGGKPYQKVYDISDYIALDIAKNYNVDIQGDGMLLPIKSSVIDTVISNEVLEHIPRPQDFMNEAFRVLKPGGILILTTPQTWGLHHEPHDYYRYTKYGLHYLSETVGFEVLNIYPTTGFISTFIQRSVDTLLHHYLIDSPKILKRLICFLFAPVSWLGLFVTYFKSKYGDTLDNVLIARKPLGNELELIG